MAKQNICGRPTPVLPTAYTEALSYGETLGKVITKVNECVDEVNENDKKVDDLTNLVGTFDNRITENTNNIAAEQAARKDEDAKLTTEVDNLKNTITALDGSVNDNTSAINKEIEDRESADIEIKEYINNNCANAIKEHVSSTFISVSDVSPLKHNVAVKASSTAVQITRCGKNIFDAVNAAKVSGASSFTNNNGVITASENKAENWASANIPLSPNLAGNTITFTCKSAVSGINKANIRIQWTSSAGNSIGDMILGNPDVNGNIKITGVVPNQPDESHNILCLMFYSNTNAVLTTGTVYTATYSDIQLEIGSTATPYTPYQGQTYTPIAGGAVLGITSISPYMTLTTNTAGVVLDVAYNKNINSNLGGYVSATDNNTFTGSNTFNGRVIVSRVPATANDVVNKAYVDGHTVAENTVQSMITPISIANASYAIFSTSIIFYDAATITEEDASTIVSYYLDTLGLVGVNADSIIYTNINDVFQHMSLTELSTAETEAGIWIMSSLGL